MKLNIPNTLSLIRIIMVPVFMATLIFMSPLGILGKIVPAIVFVITALTDMLDGKIARKYNMITDFGKFIDPLADKFMIFGSMLALLVCDSYAPIRAVFVWVAAVIVFRELGVTSLRLVCAGSSGKVIAASMLGKAKTVSQMVGTVLIILNPVITPDNFVISYVCMGIMTLTTVVSGIDYFRAYLPLIDTNK